jgi:CRISPR system Cascade subunit CasA
MTENNMDIVQRFNLIDEAWIPVGDEGFVSLRDLFSLKSYKRLSGNSIQKISIFKFLQAIAQAAFTPETEEEWFNISPDQLAKKCLDYLEKIHECFFLYDSEKPFLQIPSLKNEEFSESLGCMVLEFAKGNTTVLYRSQIESDLSDQEKAVALITFLGFVPAGKGWGTKKYFRNKKKETVTSPSGFNLGDSLLHTFCFGKNILDSLWLNLFSKEKLNAWKIRHDTPAPWEEMPKNCDDNRAIELSESLSGQLVPLSRFCRLVKDKIFTDNGIEFIPIGDGGFNPSLTRNSEKKFIKVNPAKRPWRSLSSILNIFSDECSCQLKMVFGRLNKFPDLTDFEIWSGGLSISNTSGEQSFKADNDYVESSFILFDNCLKETWFRNFKKELDNLENLATNLIKKSISSYFKNLNSQDGNSLAQNALNSFWGFCESQLKDLVDACDPGQNDLQKIRQKFADYAIHVYDLTCPKETSRQLLAWAKCRPNINRYLKK